MVLSTHPFQWLSVKREVLDEQCGMTRQDPWLEIEVKMEGKLTSRLCLNC